MGFSNARRYLTLLCTVRNYSESWITIKIESVVVDLKHVEGLDLPADHCNPLSREAEATFWPCRYLCVWTEIHTHTSALLKWRTYHTIRKTFWEQLSSDLGDKGGAKESNKKKSHIQNKHLICKYWKNATFSWTDHLILGSRDSCVLL